MQSGTLTSLQHQYDRPRYVRCSLYTPTCRLYKRVYLSYKHFFKSYATQVDQCFCKAILLYANVHRSINDNNDLTHADKRCSCISSEVNNKKTKKLCALGLKPITMPNNLTANDSNLPDRYVISKSVAEPTVTHSSSCLATILHSPPNVETPRLSRCCDQLHSDMVDEHEQKMPTNLSRYVIRTYSQICD